MRGKPAVVRSLCLLAAVALALLAAAVAPAAAAPARPAALVPLSGAGSSWAFPAIDQWSRDIRSSQQLNIDFSPNGSATGRLEYSRNQRDFAASDIAFLTQGDPFGSAAGESINLAYSYVPIVAGGTSFLYNLRVGTRKLTDLRLSGPTIVGIFTGKITNWADPAITRDYGHQLPNQHITVLTRSDGSGATYQFTKWMQTVYPAQWGAFCRARGGAGSCGATEIYPPFPGSVQRGGSDQVATQIASDKIGNGSIGYDEYAYALNNDIPVVKVLNTAGYYVGPTAANVGIALQKAVINKNPNDVNFLIQDLTHVYTFNDKRTYPLSSYSYLVVPRFSRRLADGNTVGPPPRFNDAKGQSLTTWLGYVLCGAQKSAADLGYSPLPKNLVVGGFEQTNNIPGSGVAPSAALATANTQAAHCDNPTYSSGSNKLLANAPYPSRCDYYKTPVSQCASSVTSVGTRSANGTSSGSGRTDSGTTGTGSGGPSAANGPGANGTTAANGAVDPLTGDPVGGGSGGSYGASASAVSLRSAAPQNWSFGVLTVLEIIAAIAVPTILGTKLSARARRGSS